LWTHHPSDPKALVWVPVTRASATDGLRGLWAGKLAAHRAHHRFGTLGALPHLQLNMWRVGVKGSGTAVRLPLVPAVLLAVLLFAPSYRA
jgi:hypothetical protein